MPELPEVETVRRGLDPHLRHARIKNVTCGRRDLRFPLPKALSAKLSGTTVLRIDRRAKYLLFHLSNGLILLSHLGMSGRFRIEGGKAVKNAGAFYDTTPVRTSHDHVTIDFDTGKRLVYNDARRFGFMELLKTSELERRFADIGIEPLSKAFGGASLQKCLKNRKTPIKTALLDQTLIAGIGNIYACEALHKAKISPGMRAGQLNARQCAALAAAIREVLNKAIRLGGSTLRDFHDAGGDAGRFQHEFHVYGRAGKPCLHCGNAIKSLTQAGRSTFYCPACQR